MKIRVLITTRQVRRPQGIALLACVTMGLQLLVAGCAADRNEYLRNKSQSSSTSGMTALDQENATAKSLMGTTIRLHQSRFYGYTAPNAQSCAGDAKSYIPFPNNDALESFDESIAEPGESIRPAFIKNVALDITDASTESSANRSLACSVRPSVDTKPSKCATFDLTAADSIGLTLNGTVLLLGGTPEAAGTAINGGAIDPFQTVASEFALSLSPVGTALPRSTWTDLVRDELFHSGSSTRPRSRFLPSATLNPDTGKVLLFGGSTKLSTDAAGGIAQPTADNWLFSVDSRKWSFLPTVVIPRNYQQLDRSTSGTVRTLEKSVSPRANFGYLPITDLSAANLGGSGVGPSADTGAEKILIVGGITNSQQGISLHDSYLFNPTFGPEEIDLGTSTGASSLRQWVESYHTRRISNTQSDTQLGIDSVTKPNFVFNLSTATVDTGTDTFTVTGHGLTNGTEVLFTGSISVPPTAPGGISLSTSSSATTYTVTSATSSTFKLTGVNLSSTGSGTITLSRSSGPLQGALIGASGSPMWLGGFDWAGYSPGGLGGKVSKLTKPDPSHPYRVELDPDGYVTHPGASHSWSSAGGGGVPGFGAASVHPSITSGHYIFFGGTNCPGYLSLTSSQLPTYCVFHSDVFSIDLTGASPVTTNSASDPEFQRAGIASALGKTSDGITTVIVGWGGVTKPGATSGSLLVVRPQAAPTAPLVSSIVPTGELPPQLANGQLVYSHITRKFYLFGGIVPSSNGLDLPQQPSDTWELELTSVASAKWRRLSPSCWPNCPQARRSHRMAEVNYQVGAACTTASPCSYGIFMEGGTFNGLDFMADRWMFDPSANSGEGHWLNVNGFPARRSATMATYKVTLPNGSQRTRSLMFGGETGLQAWPAHVNTSSSQVFLPPTLGDTEIFDYDTNTWNRAKLLGKGYGSSSSGGEKFQIAATISRLSPPPLSGAMMVTRTHDPTGAQLAIPEIYLIGGRKKTGRYADISGEIWKFCPQSARETGNPAPTVNTACEGPVEDAFSGRWSMKSANTTTLSTSEKRSFLGAAAYDSSRDEIVVFGGRTTATNTFVTQDLSINEQAGDIRVLTPSTLDWRVVSACASSLDIPIQRYGHSLTYDSQNNRLILVGGVALSSGSAFVHELTDPVPEVWTARYIPAGPAGGNPECYEWQKMPTPEESLRVDAQYPPEGGNTGGASLFVPPSGFGTGSYLLQDQQCAGSGPLATSDLGLSKKYSGGVTIDLDRAQLGSNENLLLKLTYIPMSAESVLPGRTPATLQDEPVIHVHLISTGMSRPSLMGVFQPRHLFFFDTQRFPHVIDKLSVLAERDGQLREEQLVIPLGSASAADRIRIERVTGSAVLLDVSISRLGAR